MQITVEAILDPLAETMEAADHALLIRWANDRLTTLQVGDRGKYTVIDIFRRSADGHIPEATDFVLMSFNSQKDEIRERFVALDAKREAERAAWKEQDRLQREQKEREEAEKREQENAAQHRRSARRDSLVDAIALRAGYGGADAIRECDEPTYAAIVAAVESYKWGPDKDLLVDQHDVDVYLASGAVYEKVLVARGILPKASAVVVGTVGFADAPNGVSGKRAADSVARENALRHARKDADPAKPYPPLSTLAANEPCLAQDFGNSSPRAEIRPSREEITDRTFDLLKANHERSFTYNQIAQSLNFTYKDAYKDVSRAVQTLAGAARTTGVIAYKVTDQKKNKIKLFKFAPWREQIDRDPSKTDRLVRRDIVRLVTDVPALSWAALRERMRDAYGHLDNAIIDRSRKALIESGEVICLKGPRGARMHYVPGAVDVDEPTHDDKFLL
ncbi:MAG: hypothetical protein H7145_01990 [Akkermansiaceae bacterium]|nr:hypothetical protein [Armatimonadota bacterium]